MNALKSLFGSTPSQPTTNSHAKPESEPLAKPEPSQKLTRTISKFSSDNINRAIAKLQKQEKLLSSYLKQQRGDMSWSTIVKNNSPTKPPVVVQKTPPSVRSKDVTLIAERDVMLYEFLIQLAPALGEHSTEDMFDWYRYTSMGSHLRMSDDDWERSYVIDNIVKHRYVVIRTLCVLQTQKMEVKTLTDIIRNGLSTHFVTLCVCTKKAIPSCVGKHYWSRTILESHIQDVKQSLNWYRVCMNTTSRERIDTGPIHFTCMEKPRLELKVVEHTLLLRFLHLLSEVLHTKPPLINPEVLRTKSASEVIAECMPQLSPLKHTIRYCLDLVTVGQRFTSDAFRMEKIFKDVYIAAFFANFVSTVYTIQHSTKDRSSETRFFIEQRNIAKESLLEELTQRLRSM